MKRFLTAVSVCCVLAASLRAVTVDEVAGSFRGVLNISGKQYPDREVYVLPGVESNTVTFVLPDFRYNNAPLGDIVLVNIPMDASGRLTLEDRALYVKAVSERASVSVLNGFVDGSVTYNSVLTSSSAQVLLSIKVSSVPEPILVLFAGNKVTNRNYAVTNGGFEGVWSDGEPAGWHSFNSATGDFVSFVQNTEQFSQSSDRRPGSAGSHSAMIKTRIVVGNNANGNCTNGQINAGSMTATDAAGNYNFSDPSNSAYNTPFVGNPDSLVFWAKYIPADLNPSNSVNKARAHAVITTNARYQDPESAGYASVKIAEAAINYSATSALGWQRLSVPFIYSSLNPDDAAYMLLTFTTNMTPGGGSSYSSGSLFNKIYYLDNVYLDDVEMIYNHSLRTLTIDGNPVSFEDGRAVSSQVFSDSDYELSVTTDGKAAKAFVGYDARHCRVHVYVMAGNYSQARVYSVYTLQMAEPVKDTEYAYVASICKGESYSDELFKGLTEAGEYKKTIPNTQGGDSLISLTLSLLPAYSFPTEAVVSMNETYTWRGKEYKDLLPGVCKDTIAFKTVAGCDSVYTLLLTVKPVSYLLEEQLSVCRNEDVVWHDKPLPTAEAGTFVIYDSLQSVYGMDSVCMLTLTVQPDYLFTKTQHVNTIDILWRGKEIKDLEPAVEPYVYHDSLTTVAGCDSVYELKVYVSAVPIAYGAYEAVVCEGEEIIYEGEAYSAAFEGDVLLAQPNALGGDSVVHLTVKLLPVYTIDRYMTITVGDDVSWEGWNLSMLEVGEQTLTTYYYTEFDCDSTIVLHLTVEPEPVTTGLSVPRQTTRHTQKVLWKGRLYIIREDETVYDVLGTKIK